MLISVTIAGDKIPRDVTRVSLGNDRWEAQPARVAVCDGARADMTKLHA